MNRFKAAASVVIAPLAGSMAWLGQTVWHSEAMARTDHDPSLSLASTVLTDPGGAFQLVSIGWLYGLALTILVGLPVGFGVAFLIKRLQWEGMLQYCAAGAGSAVLLAMLVPSRGEFWLAASVTGLLMGAAYWRFVRKPGPTAGAMQ